MTILHLSDLHFRPADADLALASLRTVRETVEREHVDLVVFSGDMFDRAIHNSEAARLPALIDEWRHIDSLCPIVGVTGTPTHDVAGCYHAIVSACMCHGLTLLEPGKSYGLYEGCVTEFEVGKFNPGLLILGCPEPSKEWWLADKTGLGREQAAQAVADGMRALLLGLGAIRKEHADLPCIFLYHGAVTGATLANGQALPPGGIQIGRDDLALVGADYVALGHIHAAQQIGDLPAYYAGSAYPCNWGEVDQKSCNLVAFNFDASGTPEQARSVKCDVTRVPFPHAPRVKVVRGATDSLGHDDVSGMQAWVVIRGTKEELSSVTFDVEALSSMGALPGSRVTFEEIPVETVRAGNIQEAAGLSAKLAIYAENSGETPPAGVPEKAAQLEAEARAEGSAPAGLHIQLDRLKLRGSLGIYKGQGVDEIDLDLSTFDDGLISLVGPNGAGKTTLLDFMHPFVDKSRGGKLQDYFRLRDSYQDLYWTDKRIGDKYRALIAIDGANASGGCDYHLYRNGEPLTDGRKASYEARIADLFGSLPLYLRSAFVTQRATRGAPELSEATKGERKTLFRELGGLDYLQAYADRAKAHRQEHETALIADQREIEILTSDTEEIPDYWTDLEAQRRAAAAAGKLVTDIELEGKDLRVQQDTVAARLVAHRKAETEANALRNQIVTLGHERGNAQQSIIALQHAIEQRPEAERQLAEVEALKGQEKAQHAARTGILLERERITAEHRRALEAHRTEQRKIESWQRELKDAAATLAREKIREMAAVDALLARLQQIVCPGCGVRFALGGDTDKAALGEKQQRVLDLDCDAVLNESHAKAAAAELAALVAPAEPTLPVFDGTALATIEDQLAGYDERAIRASIAQAATADAKIEAASARIMTIEVQFARLRGQIEGLEPRLDPGAGALAVALQAKIDDATRRWKDARGVAAHAEAEVKALEAQIAEIERKRALLAETRARVAGRQAEVAAWRWLERACGADGIQALELDAMGPGIAAVANRILEAAYGSRFQIEFRTTRIGGKGAKVKQIEDFAIIVHDSERGGEQPIETLSGGESVWVKRALYDAFGIIRDRATGQRFLTVFQDEADGALDPEARIAYVRMLEAAHAESGRRHTILITHSETVQQMIGQRIEMRELAAAKEGATA